MPTEQLSSSGSEDPQQQPQIDAATDAADPAYAPSRQYCRRLLAIYDQLRKYDPEKKTNSLVTQLPAWTAEYTLDLAGLEDVPRLQAALADATSYTPSKWLLEQELSQRRSGAYDPDMGVNIQCPPGAVVPSPDDAPHWIPSWVPPASPAERGEDVYDAAAREKMFGLCLSGGGIRSATFSLGILQAFAQADLLKSISYLSTVSGGGYIHQWFASWIHNEDGRLAAVQRKMVPLPESGSLARTPQQITWLRRYSSYLTPRRGALSVDTWTMIAIWFRNTFLNQIVLLGFLASCILAICGITYPFLHIPAHPYALSRHWLFLSLLLTVCISLRFGLAMSSITGDPKRVRSRLLGALNSQGVFWWLVIPGFLQSLLLVLSMLHVLDLGTIHGQPAVLCCVGLYILGLLLALTFAGCAVHEFIERRCSLLFGCLWAIVWFGLSAIVCAVLSVAAIAYVTAIPKPLAQSSLDIVASGTANFLNDHLGHVPTTFRLQQVLSSDGKKVQTLDLELTDSGAPDKTYEVTSGKLLTIFAPVFLFYLQFLAVRLQLGVLGRFYTESRREWLARLGGWAAIVSTVWIGLSLIALVGPAIFYWFFQGSTLKAIGSALSVIAVHAITLSSGNSSKTDGTRKPNTLFGYSALDIVGLVGAPLCVLSLLIVVSGLVHNLLHALTATHHPILAPLLASLTIVAVFLFFGWRVDVNVFSLSSFYRDRLARCYLGATNPRRTPDPFSGFDDHSEISTGIDLADLLPASFQQKPRKKSYNGPFPIFCSTINLTFGEDLAWQERKGACFAFTPLYSGYHVGWTSETRTKADTTFNGYVPTNQYAYPGKGIGLSTVAAISGAALSPNQGFSSQPTLAFLMTLFNIRLGWWLANPRKPRIWPSSGNKPTPIFGLRYLLSELFGLADDTSNYVCLCDGGRFEDMGLYELVRRRCRLIVVCDGEQENGDYQGIGGAIAKCRTDFGVEINLDIKPLIPDSTGCSSEHFRVGSLQYPAPPGGVTNDPLYSGTIIYLKTTYVGDEPGDILHHKLDDPAFPQDPTLNQWFTESDFESYRRLGQLIGSQAAAAIVAAAARIAANAPILVQPPSPEKPPTRVTLV